MALEVDNVRAKIMVNSRVRSSNGGGVVQQTNDRARSSLKVVYLTTVFIEDIEAS